MTAPELFGPFFDGPSWDNWRTVLRGAFAMQMTAEEATFFRSVTGRDPPSKRVRELAIVAGRRSGKDSVASFVATMAAATFNPNGRTRPGERPVVLLLGADRAQARGLLSYIKGYFAEIPQLKALVQRETIDGLELIVGTDIIVATSDFRLVRGRTVLCAILNETAFWQQEGSASPDVETFRAIVPATSTLGDEAMIIMISSAHRRSGLLYSRWEKFFGVDNPDTLVVHAKTRQLNFLISSAIIDAALADDPQSAEAEFNSVWRDDLASFCSRDEILACCDHATVRPPRPGVQYVSRIDASSGVGKDSMTACVGHAEGDIAVVDCIVEVVPPFSPPDACAQIAGVLRSYNLSTTTGDRWGLNFVSSEFQRHGITVEYSDKNRSDIYREALPIIRSRRARLPTNEKMVSQFASLERRTLSNGERIDHPQRAGFHDDVSQVTAAVLAALVAPRSNAENWLEYYRRLNEQAGLSFNRMNTDMDGARAAGPEFGWDIRNDSETLYRLWWPEPLVRGTPDIRFEEGRPCKSCTRAEAQRYLTQPAIRQINEALASELEESKWPR
jgi:hypothetical protein